jgi:hypothetical protein
MDTAICETEVDLGVMATDKVLELYHQNRRFGFYLILNAWGIGGLAPQGAMT